MTCATRKHSSPWQSGFCRCRFLPKWQYLAERCACAFEPSRWEKQ